MKSIPTALEDATRRAAKIASAERAAHDGLCRFNPPVSQPTADAHGLWPVVTEKDWCGHFAPEIASAAVAAE